jgi:hypothetical protein
MMVVVVVVMVMVVVLLLLLSVSGAPRLILHCGQHRGEWYLLRARGCRDARSWTKRAGTICGSASSGQ